MPLNCCVPECTKKGYRDEHGEKVSFFKFPDEGIRRKKWTHAIRRDEGKHFQIKPTTKVCSRHFRDNDFIKTLAGRRDLRADAVPSLFAWTRTSPRKRKPPTLRENIAEPRRIMVQRDEVQEEPSSESFMGREEDIEISSDLGGNMKVDAESQTNPDESIETVLKEQMVGLECELQKANRRIEALRNQLFTVDRFQSNDAAIRFYTGFQNWGVSMAVLRYLNPGDKGENISYWLSAKPNVPEDIYEDFRASETKKGRSRTLRPIEEFFLMMCRLRRGFSEEHLGHLFQISTPSVSRTFITWINFMYLKLGQINIWPTRKAIDETMPEDFKQKYGSTRVIIDCTEVKCQAVCI